jgi:hypothetical protein
MLRFGTKYEVDHLRQDAITHLCSAFPLNFEQWKHLYMGATDPPCPVKYVKSESRQRDYGGLLDLCAEFDLPFLLPALYLLVVSHRTTR